MNFKRYLIIFSLLLILCVSLSTVSATTEDMVVKDVYSVNLADQDINNVISNEFNVDSNLNENSKVNDVRDVNKDIFSPDVCNLAAVNGDNNTFLDIQKLVDDAKENSTIELHGNYEGNATIIINKTLFINGNNAVLKSKSSSIFNVSASNVVISNLNIFKANNSHVSSAAIKTYGGAIYWSGINGTLLNCNFVNCSCYSDSRNLNSAKAFCYGGAIYWSGINANISNCSFVNCSVYSYTVGSDGSYSYCYGGAIYLSSNNSVISNCSFINCSVKSYAGGPNNNKCYSYGSAIYLSEIESSIINYCSFVNCFGRDNPGGYIGAIYLNEVNDTLMNYNIFETNKSFTSKYISCLKSNNINIDFNFFGFKNTVTSFPDNLVNGTTVNNWIILDICYSKNCYFVNFVSNNGSALDEFMPDYSSSLKINADVKEITIKNNSFNNTFVEGGYVLTSLNSGNVLVNTTLSLDDSFTVLNKLIINSESTIVLDKNYSFYVGFDDLYKGGISINKGNLIIEGNGFTIDGANLASVFYIRGGNVTIKNINFINTYSSNGAGAIYWPGDYGDLVGCNFTNSYSEDNTGFYGCGGVIYWYGCYGCVSGCSFINASASYGGAIYWSGVNGTVSDCNFTNCSAKGYYTFEDMYYEGIGGAIAWNDINGSVNSCIFINSYSSDIGGAIYWYGCYGCVSGCSFINASASYGSAIYLDNSNVSIINCNCTNSDDKAPIYNGGSSNIISKVIVSVLDNSSYRLVDGKALLNATITVSGIAVTGQNLTFFINGEEINATATDTGLYEVRYAKDITKTQIVSARYVGAKDTDVKTGVILISNVAIVLANDTEFVVSAGEKYIIGITSDDVSIGSGYKVVLELVNGVNRKNYTLTTNESGQVALTINLAYVRDYRFNIYFIQQDIYGFNSVSQDISVVPLGTNLSTAYVDDVMDSTVYSGDYWITTFTDVNGQAITNTQVEVHFKKSTAINEVIYKVKSDAEGKVKLQLNLGYTGEYIVYAKFVGNSKYGESRSNNITVNITKANVKMVTDYVNNTLVTVNKSGDKFKVQLLTINDKVVKNVKLKINFTNSKGEGNVYNVTTDSDGYAYLTLNLTYVGNYTATVFFEGNTNYKPSQDSSITLIKVVKEDGFI